ncbi:unnamed protein product [Meganyctiphanes norvegica]|uniref:Fe2OG dioxygenase domain-containing protein n=1 Tax=Meganyctiphanes norvegica TaxID=48144 RepID=A0AAV2RET2_MEGNR
MTSTDSNTSCQHMSIMDVSKCTTTTTAMLRTISVPIVFGLLFSCIQGNGYTPGSLESFSPLQITGLAVLHSLKSELQDRIQVPEALENTPTTEISEKTLNDDHSNLTTVHIQTSITSELNRPAFKFFSNILKHEDRGVIKNYVHNNGLGSDPSSLHFIEREKSIRFIRVENTEFIPLERDYFIQPANYNDFSGGYKRHYKLIPSDLLLGPMYSVISHFIHYHHLPENTTILVQLQSSIIRANSTKGDVTGQGIHTDGADDAMLVCVERDDVIGAENELHAALDGSQPLTKPTVLEAGDGVVFRDNQIFHYVSDAKTNVPVTRRTLILMHSPEEGNGKVNPRNNQGTRKASIRLRKQQ